MADLALEVEELRGSSGSGRCLLEIPRLEVARGTTLGIQGPSGAGKSTLLFALAGLIPATGIVRWYGQEFLGLSKARQQALRAGTMGFVFQDHNLLDELSAAGNAGLTALFQPRAKRAAIRKGAAHWLGALGRAEPDRKITTFSGGERQRVAVARALANAPQAILADEPTASLDRPNADRLTDDLLAIVRDSGATLIAVSHDPHLLDRMDRRLTLTDGTLA
jgi:putative ABC transport system ATP-binding protein